MSTPERLSAAGARRIALAAQGFAEPRPAPGARMDWRLIGRGVQRLGLLQIDSVNVLARAHYLPLFSRLGAYPRPVLEAAAWGPKPKRLFEYWAHEASLIPVEHHPLYRWRMARAERGEGTWGRLAAFARERRPEAEAALRRIEAEGPLPASAFGDKGEGGWWGWSGAKQALEWLFWAGRLTTRTRTNSFERVYDLPERVLPSAVSAAPTPSPEEAHRTLLLQAAQALGVATAGDLADYHRLSPADAAPRLAELVEAGALQPVRVEGWARAAFLHPAARRPRRIEAAALLAPFDPLIWERGRTERLFGVRVRLEIYTPQAKREHGYYVLPFLLGERIAARVDLKSDRASGVLRVQAAHAEPDAPAHAAEALAAELRLIAAWLGLDEVEAAPRGDLAAALQAALAVG